jgi:hypothetical protein
MITREVGGIARSFVCVARLRTAKRSVGDAAAFRPRRRWLRCGLHSRLSFAHESGASFCVRGSVAFGPEAGQRLKTRCRLHELPGWPDERREVAIEVIFALAVGGRLLEFGGERCELVALVGPFPLHADASASRHLFVHGHDRASISVEEGMGVRESTHDRTGTQSHEGGIAAAIEAPSRRVSQMHGMGEQVLVAAAADEEIAGVLKPVLARPWVDVGEQRPVGIEDIGIAHDLDIAELRESSADIAAKRVVFEKLDFVGILFACVVA